MLRSFVSGPWLRLKKAVSKQAESKVISYNLHQIKFRVYFVSGCATSNKFLYGNCFYILVKGINVYRPLSRSNICEIF